MASERKYIPMTLLRLLAISIGVTLVCTGCSKFPEEDLRATDTTSWKTRYTPRKYRDLQEWTARQTEVVDILRVGGWALPQDPSNPVKPALFSSRRG